MLDIGSCVACWPTKASQSQRAASKAAVTLEKLVKDKTLCKDIRKLSTQYQTSSIEPSRASIALISTLPQRLLFWPPYTIMSVQGDHKLSDRMVRLFAVLIVDMTRRYVRRWSTVALCIAFGNREDDQLSHDSLPSLAPLAQW
ncbi:hypothetical protein LSAT2_018842 [Lamellibrachia satsuma]|nr:hypothetical protein LSAT2_018842 [Lamellibrachia satsuma]